LPNGNRHNKVADGALPFKDEAEIEGMPDDAMDVEVEGAPVVAIRIRQLDGYLRIPDKLQDIAALIENDVVRRLTPFVRR
jgi:hypothetical protein